MIQKPLNWAKPATSVSIEVSILEQRHMTFSDKTKAENILRRVNYYRFCHYANSLVSVQNDYTGLSFDDVVTFYNIDRELRSILMEALSWAEVSFRTSFAYILSNDKQDPFFYLDSSNFKNPSFHTQTLIECEKDFKNAGITVLGQDTNGNNIYEAPPAWQMVEVVSFGKISKLFCNIDKVKYLDKVGKYFGFSKTEIKSVIKSLADLRNQCAHHRKILFSNFNSTPAVTQDMRALQIDGAKIGSFIFCLHKMMKNDTEMQNSFMKKISDLYKKCPANIKKEFGTGSFL